VSPRHDSLADCHFEHGTRARYVRGCRCDSCRAANTAYYHTMMKKRIWHGGNPLVDAGPARTHLLKLSKLGIGRRWVHAQCGVADSTLQKISGGTQTQCRKETSEAILAVPTKREPLDGDRIDAAPTWRLLRDLLKRGWSKAELARRLGSTARHPALQIKKDQVNASTARKVRDLHAELTQLLDPNTEAARIAAEENLP